jgi:hypothetical protein
MYADLFANAIILTKSEARNAGKPGTETYADLMNLRRDFPNFPIKIAAASKKNNRIKGLDYDYMESYIKNHNSALLNDFFELCGKDADGKKKELSAAASYGEVKMWFLTKCPEIEAMSDRVNEIVEEARKAREAAKKSA